MKREILISATQREVRVAILEDDQLVELQGDRPEAPRMVGDIYWGKGEGGRPGGQAGRAGGSGGRRHGGKVVPPPPAPRLRRGGECPRRRRRRGRAGRGRAG